HHFPLQRVTTVPPRVRANPGMRTMGLSFVGVLARGRNGPDVCDAAAPPSASARRPPPTGPRHRLSHSDRPSRPTKTRGPPDGHPPSLAWVRHHMTMTDRPTEAQFAAVWRSNHT